MSVTFHAEVGETTGFVVACMCEANRQVVEGGTYAHYNEAVDVLRAMRSRMVECDCFDLDVFITPITDGEGPSVNMANLNAVDLLEALGLDRDQGCGALDADDFHARVLVALAAAPEDMGRPDVADRRPGMATMVLCARRPGYVQERLAELYKVAEHAKRVGRKVVWA